MSTRKPKIVDIASLDKAATRLQKRASRLGYRAVLVGGYAMAHYGSDRLTGDIDVIVPSDAYPVDILDDVTGLLSFGGVRGVVRDVKVDAIQRSDEFARLYDEAYETSKPFGQHGAIVQPQYLVPMKMIAGRTKDEHDILHLLREREIDAEKTRALVVRILGAYSGLDFDALLLQAKTMRENPSARGRFR